MIRVPAVRDRGLTPAVHEPTNEWWKDGACRQVASDIFFPNSKSESSEWSRQAMSVCLECPVWRRCRVVGLAEHYGIWGGMGARARSRVRNKLGWADVVNENCMSDTPGMARVGSRLRQLVNTTSDEADLTDKLPVLLTSQPLYWNVTVREWVDTDAL